MNVLDKTGKIIDDHFCINIVQNTSGIGIMVAHDLAMVETRVRFPYSAPKMSYTKTNNIKIKILTI